MAARVSASPVPRWPPAWLRRRVCAVTPAGRAPHRPGPERLMTGAASLPPARGLRTALGIVWEREGRWVIRARADRLAMRVVALLACLLGLAALVAAGGPLLKIGAP